MICWETSGSDIHVHATGIYQKVCMAHPVGERALRTAEAHETEPETLTQSSWFWLSTKKHNRFMLGDLSPGHLQYSSQCQEFHFTKQSPKVPVPDRSALGASLTVSCWASCVYKHNVR